MSVMIVLEGLDSSGKQTQSKLLQQKLDSIGRSAVLFSFPRYETTVGKAIRRHLTGEILVATVDHDRAADGTTITAARRAPEDALAFQCLMLVDKAEAAVDIVNALAHGSIVICDRWTMSAIAFGEADGLDAGWLQRVQEMLPEPDLNLFIDVPEEEALRRRPRMRDRFEKDREKQKIVRANYELLWSVGAEEDPETWVKVDGTGTVEEVATLIWTHVIARLGFEP